MSDAPQEPGWWQASDGKWYPPPAAGQTHAALAPPEPAPSWVRPAFNYVVSLLAIAVMVIASMIFALGVAQTIYPDLRSDSDPISRLATGITAVVEAASELDLEQVQQADSEFVDDEYLTALQEQQDLIKQMTGEVEGEVASQSRTAAINQMIGAAALFGVAFVVYRIHFRRQEPGTRLLKP
ncbi:MAG: hypothetical protein JJLCMIEE_01598 [Acidimicrobiales bacterium]|nr:MAG: hypothetical protein EDR02_04845 [Actinomycetota bacterium]MBV6508534.1 hypothetical protein [Acidimicrobiales bacterium]RIK05151.1 MAG: hypothetical protein DCC48_11065 [Acidobacteriota bacterium]